MYTSVLSSFKLTFQNIIANIVNQCEKCDLHNLDRGSGQTASICRQCDEMHLRHFTYIRHLHLYCIKTNEGWIKHHIFVV